MIVAGIDPGTDHSGIVFFDTEANRIVYSCHIKNYMLLSWCRGGFKVGPSVYRTVLEAIHTGDVRHLFVENIEAMGLAVGKSTFQTCVFIGRILEAWAQSTGREARLVSRGDEKIVICGTKTYINPATGKRKGIGDAEIRKGLIERFPATGGGSIPQVGTKAKPGPLYGVSGHCWQALAVVITGLEYLK